MGLAAAGGGRAADPGRRAGRDGDAQPAGRGAAGRCDRLRLRRHLRVPRRTRPGADPVPGETLTLVIFVLVLRALPPRPTRPTSNATGCRARRWRWRWAPPSPPGGVRDGRPHRRRIAALLPDAAYYRGHGANTVNVLLVDIRAWDTLGEISCCWSPRPAWRHWCSGTGGLRRAAGRRRRPSRCRPPRRHRRSPAAGDITWLRGSEFRDPRHRSWCWRSPPG